MIVDTSFLVAIDQDDPDAIAKAGGLEGAGVPLRVPTATIMELYVSVGLGTNPNANVRGIEALVANQPVVELGENIARRAGTLLGLHQLDDTKPELGAFDSIIAATGLVYAEPVVTADVDDFGSVDSLDVVTWT